MLSAIGKTPGEKPCNTIDTLVGVKTEVKGDVIFTGGLRIDGKVRGNVLAKGDATSTLVLSENASITGNVTAPHVIISGTIKGNVRASERVELQAKAEITGDVYYKVIEMALGAVINGNLVREGTEPIREKGTISRLKTAAESNSEAED